MVTEPAFLEPLCFHSVAHDHHSFVGRTSPWAERDQADHCPTQDQQGRIDPATKQYREHGNGNNDGNQAGHRHFGHCEASGKEQADGYRREPTLN